jgi:hypothetical protein
MKIIFSRKGWDSEYGGSPSPIFPDGLIHSLPIPEKGSGICAADITPPSLSHYNVSLGQLFSDLSRGKLSGATDIHLDPIPDHTITAAGSSITAAGFGQCEAAAGHLDKQGVVQDSALFLFFGLFRRVHFISGKWCYVRGAPKIHLIWGWMYVGSINKGPPFTGLHPGLAHHPHANPSRTYPNNRIYCPGIGFKIGDRHVPGSGVCLHYSSARQLTQLTPNVGCSDWELPSWLVSENQISMSYHTKREYLHHPSANPTVRFRSAAKGQEFVFDSNLSPPGVDAYLDSVLP